MNLLSQTLVINAIPQQPAVPTRVDRDGELLGALRRRDRTAAECLVADYGDRAYRLAKGITRNAQDAEETVNDALWSVIRKIETFRGDSSLGSWIYRIVANAALQKLRCRAHRRDELSLDEGLPIFDEDGRHADPISDWAASIDDPALQTELRAALDWAMGELPAHHRAVIVLHDVQGLSMAEVAGSLGITIATAKSRAHRARLFLRKRLSMFMAGVGHPPTAAPKRRPPVSVERRSGTGAGSEAGAGRGRFAQAVRPLREADQRAVASLSQPVNLKLIDKTALVSGSTKGIGFAVATGLAREGARVIVNGRSQKAVAEAKDRTDQTVPDARIESFAGDLSTAAAHGGHGHDTAG
jgi:RNA polymerase sigma-70 factor, ECF subfamily